MKNTRNGILSLFLASSLYGMYGIYSRMIGSNYGAFSQNWVRNLIVALIAFLLIIFLKKSFVRFQKQDIKWIIGWLLCGSWITVLTFIAFNNIQIGTVYFLLYSTMIIAGYLSGSVFYKEKIDSTKVISLLLSFTGLAIIYSLSVTKETAIFAFFALLGGFLTGFWNTLSKKFSDHYPNLQLVLIDSLASVAIAILGAMILKERFPLSDINISTAWIVVYAFTQVATVGFVIYGFKNLEAQIGSLILPVEVVFAVIFGYLFFREFPAVSSIIGGLLILSAAILPSLKILKKT